MDLQNLVFLVPICGLLALGYAWLASSSLRTSLHRLQKYLRIATSGVVLHYEEKNDGFHIHFNYTEREPALYGRDFGSVMIFIALCRANMGKDFTAQQISFAQPEPPSTAEFFMRFRCPVVFDQPSTSVVCNTGGL